MKVQVYETVSVDIETSVNVDVNDVLMEFSRRLESAEMNGDLPLRTVFLPLVDFATKLMSRIPERGIATCKDSQRMEVINRLSAELDRWNVIMLDAEE